MLEVFDNRTEGFTRLSLRGGECSEFIQVDPYADVGVDGEGSPILLQVATVKVALEFSYDIIAEKPWQAYLRLPTVSIAGGGKSLDEAVAELCWGLLDRAGD